MLYLGSFNASDYANDKARKEAERISGRNKPQAPIMYTVIYINCSRRVLSRDSLNRASIDYVNYVSFRDEIVT